MKLIIGLGNPGKEYNNTRHNIGFNIVDFFAESINQEFNKNKFQSLYFKKDNYIVMKPQTFMNLSGNAVQSLVKFYKINIYDIFVIYDDMSLSTAQIMCKPKGFSGGQNGMKDIINKLGTNEIPRMKIGIGRGKESSQHVLGKFTKDEMILINEAKVKAIEAIKEFINKDINSTMNKFN
ncbi:MAG: aminoacyl-tRNA hydrolase [Mycoplasma sp.]|nr:aminoacyl-tRNA hydrolase [Mycoplasma sp.]